MIHLHDPSPRHANNNMCMHMYNMYMSAQVWLVIGALLPLLTGMYAGVAKIETVAREPVKVVGGTRRGGAAALRSRLGGLVGGGARKP